MNTNMKLRAIGTDDSGYDILECSGPCRITGEPIVLRVRLADYIDWAGGKLIQNAMPYLSTDEREFLISGTGPTGWDKLFGPDMEDEEDAEETESW